MNYNKLFMLIGCIIFLAKTINAQQVAESQSIIRDTLDGKLDFSRFMIDAKGFLPVALLITEPALGGIGIGALPVFLTPKKSKDPEQYVPPDITAGLAMYTGNKSWMLGAIRIGSIPEVANIKKTISLQIH